MTHPSYGLCMWQCKDSFKEYGKLTWHFGMALLLAAWHESLKLWNTLVLYSVWQWNVCWI